MSEAELHWLRSRLQGGKMTKAQQGQLRFRLPVGLLYDPVGRTVLDPDEAVQEAVRLVFALFDQQGSALAIVSHFNQHHLRFPVRQWGGPRSGELTWERLRAGRVLDLLHNPLYAGAYVYGRTQTRRHSLPGEAPRIKGHTHRVKQDEWPIVLLDVHPGYITWEQFRRNQQVLIDNRNTHAAGSRGAAREGAALLQGIVLCGLCGRRMSARYLHDGTLPIYECSQAHTQLAVKVCQTLRGDRIDQAVVQCFLEAIQPAHLEVALSALDQIEARANQIDQQQRRQIERAQYEADLARRRYLAVDPDNRLVARSLEREWNEKLATVEKLEREYATLPKPLALLLTDSQREQVRRLAHDLPAIWHAPTTTAVDRKRLLRFLIKDVCLARRGEVMTIAIRWQTEALTQLTLPRLKRSWELRQTHPDVIAQIRGWALMHTDAHIAQLLNEAGYTPGTAGLFTAKKVQSLRYTYQIAMGCPQGPAACPTGQRGDGRYSARAAARLLNVNVSTIAAWCQAGQLEYVQTAPHGPRWITLTPEIIAQLRKPVQKRWSHYPTRKQSSSMVQ